MSSSGNVFLGVELSKPIWKQLRAFFALFNGLSQQSGMDLFLQQMLTEPNCGANTWAGHWGSNSEQNRHTPLLPRLWSSQSGGKGANYTFRPVVGESRFLWTTHQRWMLFHQTNSGLKFLKILYNVPWNVFFSFAPEIVVVRNERLPLLTHPFIQHMLLQKACMFTYVSTKPCGQTLFHVSSNYKWQI